MWVVHNCRQTKKPEQCYKRVACFAFKFHELLFVGDMNGFDIFIHVPVFVVDVAAAADHGHQSRQWVVHDEENNSLQSLLVPEPALSSFEHITLDACVYI